MRTGEENKGDKHSIVHTCTQSDIETLVNKHEKQYAQWHLRHKLFFSMSVWWQARKHNGVTLTKHGLIISIQHHCNVTGTNLYYYRGKPGVSVVGNTTGFVGSSIG